MTTASSATFRHATPWNDSSRRLTCWPSAPALDSRTGSAAHPLGDRVGRSAHRSRRRRPERPFRPDRPPPRPEEASGDHAPPRGVCPAVAEPRPRKFNPTGRGSAAFTASSEPLVVVLKGSGTVVTDGRRLLRQHDRQSGYGHRRGGRRPDRRVAALIGQRLPPSRPPSSAFTFTGWPGTSCATRTARLA